MSPRRSNTSVRPSGETSTELQVLVVVSKLTLRASGRGLLMSAATSTFSGAARAVTGSSAYPACAVPSTRQNKNRVELACIVLSPSLRICPGLFPFCRIHARFYHEVNADSVRGHCGQMVRTKHGGAISGRALKRANSRSFGVARSLLRIQD